MTGARFKPYPEYKDSGIEWLGEIPVHWEVVPYKTILSRNDSGVWGDDPDGITDTIVLRSTEQSVDGSWRIHDPALRKLTAHDRLEVVLEEGDLVVTKSSGSELHIGKTSYVDKKVASVRPCFSNFMQRLRLDVNCVSRVYWYFMNSPACRQQFVFLSSTTTGLGNLNGGIIGAIGAPVAPADEQQAIVDFLDRETVKIDALVEKKHRLIELLQEKRTALITHAVTKGLDPNVPMKDSGIEWLGQIPAHWAVRKLKHSGRLLGGGTPSKAERSYWEGDIPWVSPKDMHTWQILDAEDHITEQAVTESATEVVPPGSLLVVVRSGILRHTIPVAVNRCSVALNQDMKALVTSEPDVVHYYMYVVAGKQQELLVEWRSEGATVESLRFEWLAGCGFPFPRREERVAIADFLDRETAKIDTLIGKIQEAIELLKEYRTALISAAVTGKIDVRNTPS